MLAYCVIAVVVTGPFTGAWGLTRPVTESPDGRVEFNCGTALHQLAPTPEGQASPMPEPASACDDAVAHAKVLSGALIGVGLASWALIGVVLLRRRARTAVGWGRAATLGLRVRLLRVDHM